MLIKLHTSKMFTIDTAQRFAKEYAVSPKIWNEVWKRYLAEYDTDALCGYVLYKTSVRISPRALKEWIIRTEIYCRANHIMLMGVRVVQSEYFGIYEPFIITEILGNMKYKGTQDSRIMV